MKRTLSENNLRQFLEKINRIVEVRREVPMSEYSTFECGGSADLFIEPEDVSQLSLICQAASETGVPLFILGKGANILVADEGIREPVVYLARLSRLTRSGLTITAESGCSVDDLCAFALKEKLSGLEFISGLPGTVGGAVWMNARCYDWSVSDRLISVDYMDETGKMETLVPGENDFAYKKSPFQNKEWIILSAKFKMEDGDPEKIRSEMEEKREDRKSKGHYRYPCAGSVFKNNRAFGKPSGVLIDSIGLRGTKIGNAAISDFHANIIVNLGGARSEDIRRLILTAQQQVRQQLGFELEPEVLLVGDWPQP